MASRHSLALILTLLNTLVQTYLGRLILNGVKFSTVTSDFEKAIASGGAIFTYFSMSQAYYLQVGTLLIYVLVAEMLLPHVLGFFMARMKRAAALREAKRPPRTARFIKQAILIGSTDFAVLYAQLDYFLIFGFGFASGMPVLTLCTTVYIFSSLQVSKGLFINYSRTPFSLGPETFYTSLRAAFFAIFCRLLMSTFAYSDVWVFPQTSQYNLVSLSMSSLITSSSSDVALIGQRLENVPLQVFLLVGWILFLIVHLIVFTILDAIGSKTVNWVKREISSLEKRLEKDETKDNYLKHREEVIASFTLPNYAVFKNPDNVVLKAAFSVVDLFHSGSSRRRAEEARGDSREQGREASARARPQEEHDRAHQP